VLTIQTCIGPADQRRRMTIDAFREAEAEPGYLYELARGFVELFEIPEDSHGQIEENLHQAIDPYRRDHPGLIRRCGGASASRPWIPEMISGRNPDQAFVLEGTPKDARGRRPPSWAAEIVSPGNSAHERDYIAKREGYLVFGLREYWIIDPQPRQVTVLQRDDGPDWSERTFQGVETIESRLLPGFPGRVSDLWIDAELAD
jgi:Uma2 family endonuclease